MGVSTFRRLLLICTFGSLSFLFYYYYLSARGPDVVPNPPISKVHEPQNISLEPDEQIRRNTLQNISETIFQKLNYLGQDASCNVTLLCGHQNSCGLGCQLHHRAMCLAISYMLEIPLVHNRANWFYSDPWESALKPLGSNCQDRSEEVKHMYVVNWYPRSFVLETKGTTPGSGKKLSFPLQDGLGLPVDLYEGLIKSHPQPFIWLAGLFLSYTLDLNPEYKSEFNMWSALRPFYKPLVGIHVRRTDKKYENPESFHDVKQYMTAAEHFFKDNTGMKHRKSVYVATDEPSVLKEIEERYRSPDWQILVQDNLPSSATDGLKSVLKDILMLTSSDFVICGLTSNMCRLVFELKTYKDLGFGPKSLYSMDGEYTYVFLGGPLRMHVFSSNKRNSSNGH